MQVELNLQSSEGYLNNVQLLHYRSSTSENRTCPPKFHSLFIVIYAATNIKPF